MEKLPICSTDTGVFCCSYKGFNTDIDDLGLGITVYFKSLKVFIICFFLISLINIPLLVQYSTYNPYLKPTNYRDSLASTTLGNIASCKTQFKISSNKLYNNK